jgi:hypothetical protein
MISGYRHNADQICALLGSYAATNGNPLPTFQSHLQGSRDLTLEDGTDILSQNISKGLPFDAA